MITNAPEISKLSQDYGDRSKKITKSIESMESDLNSASNARKPDPKRVDLLTERLTQNKRSKLGTLYSNIKKNAVKMYSLGNAAYPVIQHSFDGRQHTFSNSPKFSKAFNESFPALSTLASLNLTQAVGEVGKRTVDRCAQLGGDGETINAYMRRRLPHDDLSKMNIPKINEATLDLCDSDNCIQCTDCKPHQEELIKAVNGAVSHDSNTGDGMRSLHIKNMITTLNSWAAHHDTRGNDMETCNDRSYKGDAHSHNLLSSGLRVMAHNLHRAYEDDYHESGGKGGGIHRDASGYGKDQEAY